MNNDSSNPASIRYLATGIACLTWLLIMIGGIVHGTGSSLACPDWPTCYGSFFPEMTGGVFFEHSHRIVAALTGFLTLVLCILLLWKGDRRLKKLGVMAVCLVIFQGVLGGITVLYRLPTAISTAHLATSMLFLCLTVAIAFWSFNPQFAVSTRGLSSARPWLIGTLIAVYLQIVLGALVRHTGAGLACMDIPFCRGSLWPEGAPPILQAHMLHRIVGASVGLLVFITAWRVYRVAEGIPALRRLALVAPCLVTLQIGLGLWSIHSALGLFPVTAHLGTGALLLVSFWLMNLILARALRNQAGVAKLGATSAAGLRAQRI